MDIKDKIKGVIFGQAIGDALGLGSEFMSKEDVEHHYPDGLSDYSQIIQDSHRSRWKKGQWTDDTDMMLCIADALITDGCINITTIASNFLRWFLDPNSCGIGRHTFTVLSDSDYLKDPHKVSEIIWLRSGKKSAANGALMRTSIIGVLQNDVAKAAEDVCKLTHYDPRCICSCVIVSEIINQLVWNGKQLTYSEIKDIVKDKDYYDSRVIEYIDKAYNSLTIADLDLDESNSIGYTLKALGCALWCLFHSESFESGLLAVVNEGGDADTNAAIACSILGAKFGYSTIPNKYIDGIAHVLLDNVADNVYEVVSRGTV